MQRLFACFLLPLIGVASLSAQERDFAKEKDKILAIQNQGDCKLALKNWNKFMSDPELKAALVKNAAVKSVYFGAYYNHAYCWYKYSETEPVVKADKDRQYLSVAARQIVRLETATNPEGWQLVGGMFRRLLAAEPKRKEEYENLKKAMK